MVISARTFPPQGFGGEVQTWKTLHFHAIWCNRLLSGNKNLCVLWQLWKPIKLAFDWQRVLVHGQNTDGRLLAEDRLKLKKHFRKCVQLALRGSVNDGSPRCDWNHLLQTQYVFLTFPNAMDYSLKLMHMLNLFFIFIGRVNLFY